MSYEAVKWALYDAPMLRTPAGKPDTAARFVLVAHAERADKEGKGSYPGPAALIEATGYDERTIDRAERRLRDAGLLIHKGTSHLGTTRWDLDMTKRRADDQQAAAEARVARRKAQDAARQRSRRERMKAAGDAAGTVGAIHDGQSKPTAVTDAESVTDPAADSDAIDGNGCTVEGVTDAESVMSRTSNPDVTDSASGCHGRSAPQTTHEPPMNHPGTIPGGTLPPDPLRPVDPPGRRIDSGNETSEQQQQPPQPDTATHDRAGAKNCDRGCTKGFVLIGERFERCACLDANVIPFPTDRSREAS